MNPTNGYHPEPLGLDDRIVRLGRPIPPVMSWLQSKPKGLSGKAAWDAATAKWRADVAEWERVNQELAREWAYLLVEYAKVEERLEAEKWTHAKDAFMSERMRRLGVPEKCAHAAENAAETAALSVAREWWQGADWSLVLLGGFGVGKTTAAAWALREFLKRDKRGLWVRAPEACRRQLFGAEAMVWSEQCRGVDVLVVDDVGADWPTDGWRSWLEDVIDARWGNAKRTLITVNNLDFDAFKTRMGGRLIDRLKTGQVFDCGTGSMRRTT